MKIFLLIAAIVLTSITTAHAATFKVTSPADDGSTGTLRWAIEQNNLKPDNNVIDIQPAAAEPLLIKLESLLPPIKGPAKVIAHNRKGSGDAPKVTDVILDGAKFINGDDVNSCPGTVTGFGPNVRSIYGAGLSVVDSGNVEISGLEIRSFCIGLLGVRSHDNLFHHNKVHNTAGAAGIEFTGDDGTPAGGSTTGLSVRNIFEYNIIYDNGDGAEFTRGTSDSIARNNTFYETRNHGNVPYSQGIEFAGAGNDRNKILDNTFTAYSDGLQLNGNEMLVSGNTIKGSTYAITVGGTAVTIKNNILTGNRAGIGPSLRGKAAVTISQNKIVDNGKPIVSLMNSAGGTANAMSPALLGIDIGMNGRTANDDGASCEDKLPDCDGIQNFPTLLSTSAWAADGKLTVKAELISRPNVKFLLEFFANHGANAAGNVEGERYLNGMMVETDAKGKVEFAWSVNATDPLGDGSSKIYVTATATNASGATSEFSDAVVLLKGK